MQSVVSIILIYLLVLRLTPADFKVGNGSSTGGTLKLMEDTDNGSHSVGLKAPNSIGSDVVFTLTI